MLNLKSIFITVGMLISATSLDALLPPLYQSANEIQVLLRSENLGQFLHSGEQIVEIAKVDGGYRIYTLDHTLEASVVYKPNERPGPAKFDIIFHDLRERD